MSGTNVILEASNALRRAIGVSVGGVGNVILSRPGDQAGNSNARLSLWLYRVVENEFRKNAPHTRIPVGGAADQLRRTPLALDLYYLLTPFGGTEDERQSRLGAVMGRMHQQPILVVNPNAGNIREELHVQLFRMAQEELSRIWEALNEPFQLSVVYQIRFVRIDVANLEAPAPVLDRRLERPEEETVP